MAKQYKVILEDSANMIEHRMKEYPPENGWELLGPVQISMSSGSTSLVATLVREYED